MMQMVSWCSNGVEAHYSSSCGDEEAWWLPARRMEMRMQVRLLQVEGCS